MRLAANMLSKGLITTLCALGALGALALDSATVVDMLPSPSGSTRSNSDSDVYGYMENPEEFAQSYGYSAETHTVTTDDGYILNLYRISSGNASDGAKPAVLVMHGIAVNAGSWFGRDADSLPFVLADEGFDVWIGCPRGTIYSKKHVSLSPDSEAFWDFSWHENGIYDVPASVSYVVEATGQEKIQYVGHSMGTTIFFVYCSMLQSCRDHIQGGYLMAPVVYMTHVKGLSDPGGLIIQSPLEILVNLFSKLLLHEEFQLSSPLLRTELVPLCSSILTYHVCLDVIEAVSGPEVDGEAGLYETRNYIRSSPDSVAYKQLVNYGQEIGKPSLFQRYDYGSSALNQEKYGSDTPPKYPLGNVTVPVSLYYGGNDFLADPQDVEDVAEDLPNVKRLVEFDTYSHLDFLLGKSARSRLYGPLVSDMLQDINS